MSLYSVDSSSLIMIAAAMVSTSPRSKYSPYHDIMSRHEHDMRSISGIPERHSGTENSSKSFFKNSIVVKVPLNIHVGYVSDVTMVTLYILYWWPVSQSIKAIVNTLRACSLVCSKGPNHFVGKRIGILASFAWIFFILPYLALLVLRIVISWLETWGKMITRNRGCEETWLWFGTVVKSVFYQLWFSIFD